MNTWLFKYNGINGHATRYPSTLWITWGGMGFHIDAACDDLRAAILAAEKTAR